MPYLALAARYWKAGLFALLLLALAIQTVRLGHRANQLEAERVNLREVRAELKAISDKRNEQKRETEKRIEQADKGNRDADQRAREIEEAPLPGDCATPPQVMGADL